MEGVKCLSAKELEDINVIYKEYGQHVDNPVRRLMFYCYKQRGNEAFYWYLVVVKVSKDEFQLLNTYKEAKARNLFYLCCNIIPCFWNVEAYIPVVFTVKILTKLMELIKEHGDTWSIAHICVSLPLPEEFMMMLLTSDYFMEHFTSTHHPKGYTLLHLAIEQNSVSTCKIIMQCSDILGKDPGTLVEDNEKMLPLQLATSLNAKECVVFLSQSQSQNSSKDYLRLLEQFQKAIESKQMDAVKKMVEADPNLVNESFLDGCSSLHKACDHQTIMYLLDKKADPSTRNSEHDTPLHTIIKKQNSVSASTLRASTNVEGNLKEAAQEKLNCIVALLALGKCNPDCQTRGGMTPLHLAVEAYDILCLKALLIFGADITMVNEENKTPLDLAKEHSYKPIIELLQFANDNNGLLNSHISNAVGSDATDDTLAHACTSLPALKGDRVLCLDGGGIKGLILIEILLVIERITSKRIAELFDWIVGTSTGGILALAMVYTDLSLHDLRCFYFGLKDKVFHKVGDLFPHCNTEALEKFLKEAVGELKLGAKLYPKVLITATDIEDFPSKLVFFNNFEEGRELGKDQYVWKAARATSAAPIYFKHFGRYIDGGIKANNPSMDGVTKIHQYYNGRKYKLACVVSLGCGIFQKKMESTDVHDCWSKIRGMREGVKNTVAMLSSAKNLLFDILIHEVSESNGKPVDNTRAFCETNGTSFYRFVPKLNVAVDLDEQNTERLVDILITTKHYIMEQIDQLLSIKKDTVIC